MAADFKSWFAITAYQPAASFSALDWYIQVQVRYYLSSLLDDHKYREVRLPQFDWFFSKILSRKPIFDQETDVDLIGLADPRIFGFFEDSRGLKAEQLYVRPVTFARFIQLERLVDPEKRRKLSDRLLYVSTGTTQGSAIPGSLMESDWLHHPVHGSLNQSGALDVVEVDLEKPDRILKQHFEEYLRLRRKLIGAKRAVSTADWAKWGILPLLDLLLWQKRTGEPVKLVELAQAVMPAEADQPVVNEADTFRKTAKRIAEDLLRKDSKNRRALFEQALLHS